MKNIHKILNKVQNSTLHPIDRKPWEVFLPLNPFHIGVFNKPKGSGGGADLPPPHVIWLSENIFIIFFTYLSLIGYQGLESKSIAFYMKNCKSQNCLKNRRFGRKSEKIENSLFRNRTFHPKNVRQN